MANPGKEAKRYQVRLARDFLTLVGVKPLTYKGYAVHVEFDAEDRLFFGKIAGITDIVSFHGETVDELIDAFQKCGI